VSGIAGALDPIEALDEFFVETNASADAGRNAGGAVPMVVKSGTNVLHGSLFFFDRNEFLASHSPLQSTSTRVQEIRNNQFGFAVGGPIIKNKTFFFLTGEIQLAVAGLSVLDTTPSPAWISAAQGVLTKYNVPVNLISQNFLSLFPSSVLTGPATANNYLANGLNTYNSYNGISKIDHRFSDKHASPYVISAGRHADGRRRIPYQRLFPDGAHARTQLLRGRKRSLVAENRESGTQLFPADI
jgi:hypothetical protein